MIETITGQEIRGQTIVFGTVKHIECTFVECTLIFDGTPSADERCNYADVKIQMAGPAAETLHFLSGLWESGAWHVVEQLGILHTGKALRFIED